MGFEPTTLRDLVGCSNHLSYWRLYGEQGPICGSRLEPHHAATQPSNDRHTRGEITSILFCLFHLPFTGETIFVALQQILLEARIESCKTKLSQALKTTALEKGFAISDNQGEGNCMFFALSEQLDLIKGIQMSHDELRRTIVQHLRENPRLVSTLLFLLGWIHLRAVSRHICPLSCFHCF